MNQPLILIVEDEIKIAAMLVEYLGAKNLASVSVDSGERAIEEMKNGGVDLILLDWMLPGIDGLQTVKRIRQFSDVPIIMLTARDSEKDKIIGLENGTDDYICKPFSLKELTARIHAHLRRSKGELINSEIIYPPFRMNIETRQAWKGERELNLSTMRFDLLVLFLKNPGRVFTRSQIMEYLSDEGFYDGFDRTIDAHIKNLRKEIEEEPSSPHYLLTVRGMGYKLQ